MKKVFFLILFISNNLFSQRSFLENVCPFNFNQIPKSKSTNIKYFIPCEWEEDMEVVMPDLLKQFKYVLEDGSLLLHTIGLKELNVSMSNDELREFFVEETFKKVALKWGDYISGRRYKIDGRYVGEIIVDSYTNMPIRYIRTIILYINYGTKLAVISFIAKSKSKSVTESLFNQYQPLFVYLFAKTKITL
jgi:hypothetical protein